MRVFSFLISNGSIYIEGDPSDTHFVVTSEKFRKKIGKISAKVECLIVG